MEERLIGLPDPIRQVVIPETFSVSQIVAADDCFLKVLMATQRTSGERLRPNPSAELGKVFHSLLENAVKGFSAGEETSLESLERILDRLLEETRKRLERDLSTSSYADLTHTLTPLAWERKRRSLVDAAFEFLDSLRHRKEMFTGTRKLEFNIKNAKGNGRWVEVPIHIPTLRLRGRIDVLERIDEDIKIVDLKSGRIEDICGEIKPKIVLQLRLYGILVQNLYPSARVTLVVNDGMEHMLPFDPAIIEETKAWLWSKMNLLVTEAIHPAKKFAKVGSDCRWCDIRHRCENYLREVPGLWGREIDWPLPLDTWGIVERLTPKNDGLVDLTILDVAGRRVKICSVREIHLTGLVVGKHVWLFDLATSRPALRWNSWMHPLNFYEIGDSSTRDMAWSLGVFHSN